MAGRTWPVFRGLAAALLAPSEYDEVVMQEKFSASEVESLRNHLLHDGLDSFQVADAIKVFVAMRGYGISVETARKIASKIENARNSVEFFREGLESLALVM
jgi:hypothetical protein